MARPRAQTVRRSHGRLRTSCPRLTVWEDATHRGFIARTHEPVRGPLIHRTALGRLF